ncbi:MAG: 4-hydroxyphenylpyruvate dioxygenase [Candidatus Eisenbacteria bacterium]|nr:4-hydroxyphenylpyruvate dioxygenase [Candidatus Eisenbacteria bacterium]
MSETAPLGVRGIDHVEIWVGNAAQAAYFYRTAFGFDVAAYSGPETGVRDRASYALERGKIRLAVTAPILPEGAIAAFVHKHGDAVRDIVFETDDAEGAYQEAIRRGALGIETPRLMKDEAGSVVRASIRAYGDVVHTFLQRSDYVGPFLPGYAERRAPGGDTGLLRVDHVVANVEDQKMDAWVGYYSSIFGFRHFLTFDDKDISTEYSALRSKVMASESGAVKLPINEPAPGMRRSQIQEYIDFNLGPGVQHIALLTGDILETIGDLRERGVSFLEVPDAYYDQLPERVGEIEEDLDALRRHKILVDRDQDGYLLQLFTRPVEDRPTLFYEVIQRKGSQGFGKGNFKALFEAIEREQALRGNL